MMKQEFMEEVRKSIADYMGEGARVSLNNILKNNAVVLSGLTIMENGRNIAPTIYLDELYHQFEQGRDFSNIVYEIIQLYEKNKEGTDMNVDFFADYQKAGEKAVCKLVNYEQNRVFLEDVPYVRFLDLAIIFYCLVLNDSMGSAVIIINHKHLEMWGITLEELYEKAKENTRNLLGCRIKKLTDVLRESLIENMESDLSDLVMQCKEAGMSKEGTTAFITGMIDQICADEDIAMFVLSNLRQLNGAVCIIYPDILEGFADEMEQDLYIIPSSIHEVLLLPAQEADAAERLSEMVREVNSTQVETDEVLANHVYFYSRCDKKVIAL